MTTTAAPFLTCLASLSYRLVSILGGLRDAVSARGGRDRTVTDLVKLLWIRLSRLRVRCETLVARLAAGHPAAPRRQRAQTTRTASAGAPRLPHGHYWLFRLLPSTAACYGSQLQALLAEPEVAALLAAAPEAGRILRPLCRLLGVWPEGLLALPSAAGKLAPQQRAAKIAPVAPPSAIALICAALSGQAPAAAPDPPARKKPPWLRQP